MNEVSPVVPVWHGGALAMRRARVLCKSTCALCLYQSRSRVPVALLSDRTYGAGPLWSCVGVRQYVLPADLVGRRGASVSGLTTSVRPWPCVAAVILHSLTTA